MARDDEARQRGTAAQCEAAVSSPWALIPTSAGEPSAHGCPRSIRVAGASEPELHPESPTHATTASSRARALI